MPDGPTGESDRRPKSIRLASRDARDIPDRMPADSVSARRGSCSVEQEIDDDQHECRDTENPGEQIFAHDLLLALWL
jgi:hypothetical protein